MFTELDKYTNHGHFFFKANDTLSIVSKEVPNLHGVYYILRHRNDKVELVYVGSSGRIEQNGKFSEQSLYGRLNNRQDKMSRQNYFKMKFVEENIEKLEIHWFVTVDKQNRDLPGYVEALLIQRYYESKGELPKWNKRFPT